MRWVSSRVTIPAALSDDLFDEPGRAGLIGLLVGTLKQVVGVAGVSPTFSRERFQEWTAFSSPIRCFVVASRSS